MEFIDAFNFEGISLAATMAGRIVVAAILGALIGYEREYMGKAAGLRTYSLVSLGACLFTLISIFGVQNLPVPIGVDSTYFRHNYDASRIASQIVVGIGFLGAGLIIRRENHVEGLTTAAGLWVSAALGTAIGFGFYAIAGAATVVALAIFLFLKKIEPADHSIEPD